ncbi:MAG TPA: DUF5679 domain-containing protein [Roseiflexaceae bacterium]|nr:DUF5679 domain-containing protein [Roseiflexaceae bacterium]
MFKRMFWLGVGTAIGWMLWSLWRQRQDQLAATSPFLAPLEPPTRTAPTLEPRESRPRAFEYAPEPQPTPLPAAASAPEPAQPAEAPEPTPESAPGAVEATAPATDTPEAADAGLGDVVGYCPRCKTKRTIAGAHEEITESGRRAARGTCPVCNGRMFTFLPNK